MIRYPAPPPKTTGPDDTATCAARARERNAPHACRWCGRELAVTAKRTTCSHACRSALARYERAMREGREVPTYRGVRALPAGVR